MPKSPYEYQKPNKPQIADFYLATVATTTYYTALDITNGRGELNRVAIRNNPNGTNACNIRITIDGGTPINFTTLNSMQSRPLGQAYGFDIIPNISFLKSLKVEARTDLGTGPLECSVDYSLYV